MHLCIRFGHWLWKVLHRCFALPYSEKTLVELAKRLKKTDVRGTSVVGRGAITVDLDHLLKSDCFSQLNQALLRIFYNRKDEHHG